MFSAILYLLVLSRLWDVATSHRRALLRERAVRQAGVALVSAVTVDQVGAAVRSAADTLLSRAPRMARCCSPSAPTARSAWWPRPRPSRP